MASGDCASTAFESPAAAWVAYSVHFQRPAYALHLTFKLYDRKCAIRAPLAVSHSGEAAQTANLNKSQRISAEEKRTHAYIDKTY